MRLILGPRGHQDLRTRDDGFTLVELMVTMFVIATTLLGLIAVQVQALQSVGLSKQRQQATALANRTMEQLRALPYDTVTGGLNSADLAGDPNIQLIGGVQTFKPQYDTSISEVLQTSSGQTAAPLYKHTQDASTPGTPTKIGNVQYRVRTYVSRVDPVADMGFHLTVITDWTSAVTAGKTKMVAVRSRVFSPTGCSALSTATRPFAGPCQAFFYSDAGTSPAGISVASIVEGAPLIVGTDVTRLEAKLPGTSVRTQSEQILSSQSVVSTSEVVLTTTSGAAQGGGQTATSAADTDPASGLGSSPASPASVSYSGSSTLSHSGPNGSFGVAVPSNAAGSTYSTTAATSSPECDDDLGTALPTNLACSTGNVTPNGTYSASMNLNLAGRNLGNTTLASIVSPGTSAWRAYGARATLPVAGHCSGTSGIGCVAAGARRSLGASEVGRLPAAASGDVVPSGFTSMARLDAFSAVAGSEAGISPGASAATRGPNTLTYWNGTGYSTATLGAGGAAYTLGSATGTYRLSGLPTLTVTMTGSVTVEPSSSVSSGSSPCQSSACTVTSTVGAVRVAVQYDIVDNGTPLGSFVVTANLGSTIAQTTYKAAPSA